MFAQIYRTLLIHLFNILFSPIYLWCCRSRWPHEYCHLSNISWFLHHDLLDTILLAPSTATPSVDLKNILLEACTICIMSHSAKLLIVDAADGYTTLEEPKVRTRIRITRNSRMETHVGSYGMSQNSASPVLWSLHTVIVWKAVGLIYLHLALPSLSLSTSPKSVTIPTKPKLVRSHSHHSSKQRLGHEPERAE